MIEMMTAIAVLSLLVVLIAQLFNAATTVTSASRQRLDADSESRMVLDRMGADFTRMLKRTDVDFHFVNNPSSNVNDSFFFFSEVPGYFNSTLPAGTGGTDVKSNVALVGYRINASYQLERMAKGLTWDVQSASAPATATQPVVFLTFPNTSQTTPDYTPAPLSTIEGNSTSPGKWPNLDQPGTLDTDFHVLGESIFRLAFCFFLKDGTYSLAPALNTATPKCNIGTSSSLVNRAPMGSDSASKGGYAVGSRWYDNTNFQGYICTYGGDPNDPTSLAIWQPLGMGDVQAIVVAVAILDQSSQKLISTNTSALSNLAAAFPDPTTQDLMTSTSQPPKLMAETWQNVVNQPTFYQTAQVPQVVASQVRIYQRFFYLNN